MSDMIYPPWSDEQVAALNAYQSAGVFHPYTCPNEHVATINLIASRGGWSCYGCDYVLQWAWAWSASGTITEHGDRTVVENMFIPADADDPSSPMRLISVSLDTGPSLFPGEPPHLVGDDGLTDAERADLAAEYWRTGGRPPTAWFPRHMVGVVPGCVGHGEQHTDDICTVHGWAIIDPGEDDPPELETPHREVAEYVARLWNRDYFAHRKPCGCMVDERCSEDRLGYANNPGPETNGLDHWMDPS